MQHVEGEIKVKATSAGSCSGGSCAGDAQPSRAGISETRMHGNAAGGKRTHAYFAHAGVPLCSVGVSAVMDESACRAHGGPLREARRRPLLSRDTYRENELRRGARYHHRIEND